MDSQIWQFGASPAPKNRSIYPTAVLVALLLGLEPWKSCENGGLGTE